MKLKIVCLAVAGVTNITAIKGLYTGEAVAKPVKMGFMYSTSCTTSMTFTTFL